MNTRGFVPLDIKTKSRLDLINQIVRSPPEKNGGRMFSQRSNNAPDINYALTIATPPPSPLPLGR